MECLDYSEFQEALKNMRKIDDIIINTINSVIPTDSFQADHSGACRELYQKVEKGNAQREQAIRHCINVTAKKVQQLREQKDSDPSDPTLAKSLRSEQTKLRMLQVELSVEDLTRQRTDKVLSEKCRKFYKP